MAMMEGLHALLCLCVVFTVTVIKAQDVLTPPYLNIALGRKINATSTCGQGLSEPELYCKLTGANREQKLGLGFDLIQGQLCDRCDPSNPEKNHIADYAIDGTENWWQSPPLSRGLEYNKVNLTIDLGQEFHVAYVFIKMANSPRPGVFALERSTDYGRTWKPWQYFADTPSDCYQFFGNEHPYTQRIEADNSVVCTTEYSKVVPLENGEIVVSLVNDRPSANNFSYSQSLQDWTKATTIRLRLLRTKTLLGHLMAVERQENTVTRRYFYSIKDISIGGLCVCNGHAEECDPSTYQCRCAHNTMGPQCDECEPNFIQKPWRPATIEDPFVCEPCECHGHSNECIYDPEIDRKGLSIDIHGNYEGGGVCQNCRHNTIGINCEQCAEGYFRPRGVSADSPSACRRCQCDLTFTTGDCQDGTGECICKPQYTGDNCERCSPGYYGYPTCLPCECNINGTLNGVCENRGGRCPCKPNYDGANCDRCAYGFYNFPYCTPCECDSIGSLGGACEANEGQCRCRNNYGGRDCGECAVGYFGYPNCQYCSCDTQGTTDDICDTGTGVCLCQDNFTGPRCDRCAPGYYGYPNCIPCTCEDPGSRDNSCDQNGQCTCNYNFAGRNCDRCAPGYFKYPECLSCDCDNYGSLGRSCNQETGQCDCQPTFQGTKCNECKPNYYNYPMCEECNCNPNGAKEVEGYPLGGCGSVTPGLLCECKDRVMGKICDTCKPGFWDLDINNPLGCSECGCHRPGTIAAQGECDMASGQCVCKPYTDSRKCNTCATGTYNIQDTNVFGCIDCECDAGGALGRGCDVSTGECTCRPRVNGRRCESPIRSHYYPTLYQYKYEMEDGRTSRDGPVRYGFDSLTFPEFSWRGYAIFSRIQDEVLVDVNIRRPSLYRLVFNFVNRNANSVTADVTVKPQSSTDVPQASTVVFPSTGRNSDLATVLTSFVLNPGRWSVSLKTSEDLFVDYLVLLPQDYYEATILQQHVIRPCELPDSGEPCRHFSYVDLAGYATAQGEKGFYTVDGARERTQLYPDTDITKELGTTNMAYLDRNQDNLDVNMNIPRPGQYYIVVQYRSPKDMDMQNVQIEVQQRAGSLVEMMDFRACPYSSLCRAVVNDINGDAQAVQFDDDRATISLRRTSGNIDLAVDSIVLIPADEWHLGLLKPQFTCVRVEGSCRSSGFVSRPNSVRVEVESGANEDRVAEDLPASIIDTNVKVIKLDGNAPTVNVKTAVSSIGTYAFVVHYYQPYSVGFNVDIDVQIDGVSAKGYFFADYCPSVSGCRAVVMFPDSPNKEFVDVVFTDITMEFINQVVSPIWLDYVIVTPSEQYEDDMLAIQPIDLSAEFIQNCGANNFYTDSSASEYCRKAIFSLTTEYNNGALSCDCDVSGSVSFNCDPFGGQCQCKENVIGRTCSQCRTGYYGFPNCVPCNCPSGLCDPVSGQCVCPPRVTGPDCNVCVERTFGYDPYIGCEDCNCEPRGVMNNNLDCDVRDGQCSCKANIGGRRCDRCTPGYYRFPRCLQCNCDTKGTIADICDQRTADCLCKDNVEGLQCTDCKPNTFYIEDRNPKGCTDCFCFDITNRCSSSNWRWDQVMQMQGWGVSNVNRGNPRTSGTTIELNVQNSGGMSDPDQAIYWIAPDDYLGNKVTSYGGKLIYTVNYEIPQGGNAYGTSFPDVRIEGRGKTIIHYNLRQPEPNDDHQLSVDILESAFIHEATGNPVTREEFMMILSGIITLHVRASYYSEISRASITDVILETASPDGTGSIARNVEQCDCPVGYQGTSCEQCADGYYRQKGGRYLGTCVPCQCNGKSRTCNKETGECTNCEHNFTGPQCISCMQGHYKDPITDTCVICACPLPIHSNNFATTCQVPDEYGNFNCLCFEGYSGPNCDRCDIGWFGRPTDVGGKCEQCPCNNNLHPNDPLGCDSLTGECLRCINNSTGDNCERCKDWWWGDAITRKDCKDCQCNRVGSEYCDHRSGRCQCKPNVVGDKCDRCAPGAFGFESGAGCQLCSCAPDGSYSDQCDVNTGRCQCKPGVTGRRCDQCQPGYWNYGPQGCTGCNCESDGATTCDPVSGRCQCLPGVTGEKCDSCLPRWALVEGEGCMECDNCVHLLLDDVDILEYNVTTIIKGLDDVTVGIGAIRRLQRINQTVTELRPRVDNMVTDPQDPTYLDDLKREFSEVEELSRTIHARADQAKREAALVETDSSDVRIDAEGLEDLVNMAVDEVNKAVKYTEDVLENIINSIKQGNASELVREAERILLEIRSRDFSGNSDKCEEELEKAIELLERVNQLWNTAEEQANRTLEIVIRIQAFEDKMRDLANNSRHSLDNSQAAKDLNTRNEMIRNSVLESVDEINRIVADIKMMQSMAGDMLDEARQFLDDAREAYLEVERQSTMLEDAVIKLTDRTDEIDRSNKELKPLVDRAMEHALSLWDQYKLLDGIIHDTQESAQGALNATNAYKAIVDAINAAENSSRDAIDSAMKALDLSNGLAERARLSKEKSIRLKAEADEIKRNVTDVLKPRLDIAIEEVDNLGILNKEVRDHIDRLQDGMDKLPAGNRQQAQDAVDRANRAKERATQAKEKIQDIVDQLPEDESKLERIPDDITEAQRDIRRAEGSVNNVEKLIPEAMDRIAKLREQADQVNQVGEDLTRQITILKDKISTARGQANLIKLGMTFYRNTSLQLRNPKNLQRGTYNKISLFFKTQADNALLLYMGAGGNGPNQNEYMSLEIINGQVVFKYDLGSGAAEIVNPIIVNNGKWHEVIAERLNKGGTLTVRNEDGPQEARGESSGDNVVLELNPITSKFYVGGIPDGVDIPVLTNRRFVGCMEDMNLEGVPVGLWDFVKGENNNRGCLARDQLTGIVEKVQKFDGNGYIVLEKRNFNPRLMSPISFKFRTYAEDGLMLLMGSETDFLSVELIGGKVVFKFELGSGTAVLTSEKKFNDGEWHEVQINRRDKTGLLMMDGQLSDQKQSPGRQRHLSISDEIYIGGYDGTHNYPDVTQKGFEGCIENLVLDANDRDLNDHLRSKGVIPGCVSVARVVSFGGDALVGGGGGGGGGGGIQYGYIAMPPVNVDNKFAVSMKIKTTADDGLLFYTHDDSANQANAFSISQVNGKIVVIVTLPNGQRKRIETDTDTYNDGAWHYLTVNKDGRDIMIYMDDTELLQDSYSGNRRIDTTSKLYFGGVPSKDFGVIIENVGTDTGYIGCIGDVTVNGVFINFGEAKPTDQRGASLAACPIPDPTPPPVEKPIPSIPPFIPGPIIPPGENQQCKLPLEPAPASAASEQGKRFGSNPESRWEFDQLPDTPSTEDFRIRADLSLSFKTTASDGVLFFVLGNRGIDFIGIFMQDGYINYAYNPGSGAGRFTSERRYNDGQWHTLKATRDQRRGELIIDDGAPIEGRSEGQSRSINVPAPYYVGGLNASMMERASEKLNGTSNGFVGCISDFKLNDAPFEAPREFYTMPCSANFEPGTFFSKDGGYIDLINNFVVGLDLDASLEVKPRTLDGVLLSVAGDTGDWLVLQMVDGVLDFSVDNGRGKFNTSYAPPFKAGLCDGEWHKIDLIKAKNVVSMTVDGVDSRPGLTEAGVSETNTNQPLYIGGAPDFHPGIRTRDPYVGCIKNVVINSMSQNLASGRASGDVMMNSCPTT